MDLVEIVLKVYLAFSVVLGVFTIALSLYLIAWLLDDLNDSDDDDDDLRPA